MAGTSPVMTVFVAIFATSRYDIAQMHMLDCFHANSGLH
ncbi:hypothetical protein J2W51_005761 [Tardiphaga robiniae]|jgi:hypothetical protein|nr:hypothetical protein [Tardiphaga robiniae]